MDLKYMWLLEKLEQSRLDRINIDKLKNPFDQEILKLSRSIKFEAIETADMVD